MVNLYLVPYCAINDDARRQLAAFATKDVKNQFIEYLKGVQGVQVGDWYELPNGTDVDDANAMAAQLGGTVYDLPVRN